MYKLDKKNVCIVLAVGIFLIAGINSAVYAERQIFDYDNEYDYDYNNDYEYDYNDDSTDRSDYDTRSYTDLEDIKQNNKNGDNIIIVENKQESIVDKAKNFYHEILGDSDGRDYYNSDYEKEESYGNYGSDFGLNVIVAFSDHYDQVPDLKVTANGKTKNLNADDLERSRDGYLIFETDFSFQNLNKNNIKVCILPEDAPKKFANCKNVNVEYGNQKTVRFFVS